MNGRQRVTKKNTVFRTGSYRFFEWCTNRKTVRKNSNETTRLVPTMKTRYCVGCGETTAVYCCNFITRRAYNYNGGSVKETHTLTNGNTFKIQKNVTSSSVEKLWRKFATRVQTTVRDHRFFLFTKLLVCGGTYIVIKITNPYYTRVTSVIFRL